MDSAPVLGASLTDYFRQRLCTSLRVTQATWDKFMQSEAAAGALQNFVESPHTTRLLFYLEGRDLMAVREEGSGPAGPPGGSLAPQPPPLRPTVCFLALPPSPAMQTTALPGKLKRKTVYFLKLVQEPLGKEGISKQVGAGG